MEEGEVVVEEEEEGEEVFLVSGDPVTLECTGGGGEVVWRRDGKVAISSAPTSYFLNPLSPSPLSLSLFNKNF